MTPAELENLINRGESRNLELKGPGPFKDDFRAQLTLAMAAMANSPGGGTIVVGVFGRPGAMTFKGLTAEELKTFDVTQVMQFVRERLDPAPSIEIEYPKIQGHALVELRVVEFEDVPIVVKRAIQHGSATPLAREGDLLIRTLAAETRRVSSADELRELLGRAIRRKSENLLAEIRAVVTGAAPTPQATTPDELFEKEIPTWLK